MGLIPSWGTYNSQPMSASVSGTTAIDASLHLSLSLKSLKKKSLLGGRAGERAVAPGNSKGGLRELQVGVVLGDGEG